MSKQAILERRRAARMETERAAQARATCAPAGCGASAPSSRPPPCSPRAPIAVSSSGGAKPAAARHDLLAARGDPRARRRARRPEGAADRHRVRRPAVPGLRPGGAEHLPALIRDQVRAGKVKLAVRTLHFLGPDSERAARVAAGAERQGRLWAFLEAFYARQGPRTRAT